VNALRVRTSVALQLRFNPIDRGPIAIRALFPVAEFGQAANRRFIARQVQPAHHRLNRIVVGWRLCRLHILGIHGAREDKTSRDGE
jgi:hypothetical protein